MRNELGTDKLLIDPASGQQFVYLGAGRTENDAAAIIAHSPVDMGSRGGPFGDGSVAELSARQFEEAMQRGYLAATASGAPSAGVNCGAIARSDARRRASRRTGTPRVNGAAATSPGELTGLLARGIRPIRIEIPRTGQKFTFTKVLNVGDEALKLEALAVASKVLNTVRSVLQVTVFVGGLLLLGWQLRRVAPRSLW